MVAIILFDVPYHLVERHLKPFAFARFGFRPLHAKSVAQWRCHTLVPLRRSPNNLQAALTYFYEGSGPSGLSEVTQGSEAGQGLGLILKVWDSI